MIVVVALNPSKDKLATVPAVKIGRIHRPTDLISLAGGKGLNAARAALSLGASVKAIFPSGGFCGNWIEQELIHQQMSFEAIPIDGESRSCLSVFSESDGSLTEFYESGPKLTKSEWGKLCLAVEGNCGNVEWVVIAGSTPPGISEADVGALVSLAHDMGAKVAVDLRGDSLLSAISHGAELVKVNMAEAGEAIQSLAGLGKTGLRGDLSIGALKIGMGNLERSAVLARLLNLLSAEMQADRAFGITSPIGEAGLNRSGFSDSKPQIEPQVHAGCESREWPVSIVTDGDEGASIALPNGTWTSAISVSGKYPVGCGDAFMGAFVALLDSESAHIGTDVLLRAFSAGMGASMANALEPGAGKFDPYRAQEIAARTLPRSVWVRTLDD
ncbi:MAG TPA: PfkB family carbohydrate kinase [Acidimicrobiales bacterium]|nr:PfkB family carbohydrate kinase [Acidimicrobiales bacterium]